MRTITRLALLTCLLVMLLAPVNGYPGSQTSTALQPPWTNNGDLTLNTGCTCHGAGAPSVDVVISVSGVPRAYELDKTYNFTITLQHASNAEGGFILWDYGAGTFEVAEGVEMILDGTTETGAIGHTVPGNDWVVNWTAPASDVGEIHFSMAGNAVDGLEGANAGDAWNLLSFTSSAPGTATAEDNDSLATKTVSVGDYQSLFVTEKDPEALEAERQEGLALSYFEMGNIYFWSTLSILLIAAVLQGEFYERRFGGGPTHLDISIAVPQGILKGVVSLGLLIIFGWAWDSGQAWGTLLVLGMLTLWGGYSTYRIIAQAQAPANDMDLV
jgi:hypothetical protein